MKIGDIFSVQIDPDTQKFFQWVGNDAIQLNSNVIRVFKSTYAVKTDVDLISLASSKIDFYAHTIIRLGIRMNLWKKVGTMHNIGTENLACQYGYSWYLHDACSSHSRAFQDGSNHRAVGMVINPAAIVERMNRRGKLAQ